MKQSFVVAHLRACILLNTEAGIFTFTMKLFVTLSKSYGHYTIFIT